MFGTSNDGSTTTLFGDVMSWDISRISYPEPANWHALGTKLVSDKLLFVSASYPGAILALGYITGIHEV